MLTKIINIEARWMRSVTDFLPAGDYKVEYIGLYRTVIRKLGK